jgi:hypothetical protein
VPPAPLAQSDATSQAKPNGSKQSGEIKFQYEDDVPATPEEYDAWLCRRYGMTPDQLNRERRVREQE